MAAVAFGMVFVPVLALSRVPQSPVQLARAAGVVVVPTVTFPPVVGEATTFSVHCGVNEAVTVRGDSLALVTTVQVPAMPLQPPPD